MIDFQQIGKYKVTGKLGQGSFGVVYRGRDAYLKRDVAIKVCSVDDSGLRQRFFREAEISGKLVHKNIVTVYEFGFEGDVPYLVQEMLSGEDLSPLIKRRAPIQPAVKLDYLLQIARGLGYAHTQGVIHRDIKPGNIRVLEDGAVKIMDFGIAKLASAETQLTQKGVTMGTASYLPPEQVRGGELDHRADIFSFGVLAYELLTYQRPFRGNTLSALVYQILYKVPQPMSEAWSASPPPLAALIAKCLEKKPERRYASFGELIPELTALREEIEAGEWPALTAAPEPAAPAGPTPASEPSDVLSPTVIGRTAQGVLEGKVGEYTISTTASAEEILRPPAGGHSGRSTQPIAARPSEVPVPEKATEDSPDSEALKTRILPAGGIPEPEDLSSTAQQISDLVAQGRLEAAKEQLEATINRQDLTGISEALGSPPEIDPSAETRVISPDEITDASPLPESPAPVDLALETPELETPELEIPELETPAPETSTAPAAPATPQAAPPLPPATPNDAIGTDTYKTVIGPPFERSKWVAAGAALLAVIAVAWWLAGGDPEPEEVVAPDPAPPVATAVPPPAPSLGGVAIHAAPWAEVTEITNAEGYLQKLPESPQTPLFLELEPGGYKIQLRHAESSELQTCDLEVALDAIAECHPAFAEVSVTDYFKDSGWWP